MRIFGLLILIGGICIGVYALNMDTSVKVDYPLGNLLNLPERVNNIGLMNDKQNYLIFSGIISLVGVIIVFSSISSTSKVSRPQREEVNYNNSSIENQTSIPNLDKRDLLNQLSQLHDLKEKNVISEQIYEQEKAEILAKFPDQNISNPETIAALNTFDTSTYQEIYEESFTKPEWYKQGKYWIWIIVVFFASLFIWFLIPKAEELSNETIFAELNKYCIKEFENEKKTKGSLFFEDRKYIDSFYSKMNKGDDGEIEIKFYPAYSRYTNAWKLDNDYKLQNCISSYTFQFDTTKLDEYTGYKESKISKIDINNDGMSDFIVNGYFHDCSGGSGSEGKYFLTFINTKQKIELTDVLITLPLEYTITGDKLVVKGDYKSWYDESVYNFDQVKKKWIYNKSESKNTFDE
jgi:hypothetical protein